VFEDDKPLAIGHAPHEDIRRRGEGRYSHWNDRVYFSASDNTDPTRNGRVYTVMEQR
jgi:hypothetical protein